MSVINEVGDKIQDSVDSTNLKFATRDARSESEAIKKHVREKMANLTAENKESSSYANLVSIHDQIEANHDAIYLRPENGVSASSAKEDCEKLLLIQEDLEVEFNLAFAELTSDPTLVNETLKLQADRSSRDALAAAEQVKQDAITKANETADTAKEVATEAKENVSDWQETVTDKIQDLGDGLSNAFDNVKDKFQSPKPRP